VSFSHRSGTIRFHPGGGRTAAIHGALRVLGIAVALLCVAVPGFAQQAGRIVGRVVSTQTGEGIPGARVTAGGVAATADASGRYVLPGVPLGQATVAASALGYSAKSVTGVSVVAGRATELDVALATEALALEGLTVTAQQERGTTTALLDQRMRAAVVVDAIGRDQISRGTDSDAAEALQRVPGVTVEDGKFVYVRGLGERYGATTLNGAPMPSPLPDKKAVPLDVIPANLLESVVTAKTYSPEQPGDYAGGLVQINTRSVPTRRTLRISTGFGYNTAASFSAANQAAGGNLDFLGFDDGDRALPEGVLRGGLPSGAEQDPALAGAVTRRFGMQSGDQPVNQSYALAFGDEVAVGGTPVGVVGTVSLSNSYGAPQDNAERVFKAEAAGAPARELDFDVASGEHETSLGSLLGLSFELAPAQRITATGTYNRLVEDQSRVFTGTFRNAAEFVEAYQTRYVANSIANLQLQGEHLIGLGGGISARWRTSYGRALRDEPGTRVAAYGANDAGDPTFFLSTSSSGLLFAQELEEDLYTGGLDLKVPFTFRGTPAFFSFGGSGDHRDRAVFTRRIFLSPNAIPGDVAVLRPGELFVPERIGTDAGQFTLRDRTLPQDNYDASQTVLAGYGMFDAEILPRLRAVGGARVEYANQDVSVRDFDTPGTELDNTDVLPALNLTYAATVSLNLRAAVSRTVARPQFRERAPFLYEDFFGAVPTRGNPLVERASILNYDLRGEWLSDSGLLFSASGFYKHFDDPIEPVFFNLGTNLGQSFANSESAAVYGAEFETRIPLGALSESLDGLTLNGNLTLAASEVTGDSVLVLDPGGFPVHFPVNRDGDRALFGQAPYVVNVGLSYLLARTGTSASVMYNRSGRRLEARGINQLPDIYEEDRGRLDLVLEQPVGRGVALKLSAERLLGENMEFSQSFPNGDTVVTRGYDPGRTFSLSLSWEPWER
jgi:hypothetical protein